MRTVDIVLGCALMAAVVVIVALYLPFADDWHHTFRPAALHLLQGGAPYDVETYYNPPWALLPLVPIALLPENIGRAILLVLTLLSFTFVATRLGARPIALGFLLISPPAMQCFLTGNIDWLAALGLVLPPHIGLFFVLIKPQIGGAVAFYWLIESFREGGLSHTARVFAPVVALLLLSLLPYGLWPAHLTRPVSADWNASLWPMSIPAGLGLLAAAIRRREPRLAMAASPCLSPYVALQSWIGALCAVVAWPVETVAAVIGLWILAAIRLWGG
jgi:hypothetical protein